MRLTGKAVTVLAMSSTIIKIASDQPVKHKKMFLLAHNRDEAQSTIKYNFNMLQTNLCSSLELLI